METFVGDRVFVQSEQIRHKQKLIKKINQLQNIVVEAPVDLDIPRHSVSGILRAAAELVNVAGGSPVEAEQRMRIELDDALVPLGYIVHLCPRP